MWETIVVIAIVLVAGLWFVRWFRGAASGERGCSCGSCGKDCPSRIGERPEPTNSNGVHEL